MKGNKKQTLRIAAATLLATSIETQAQNTTIEILKAINFKEQVSLSKDFKENNDISNIIKAMNEKSSLNTLIGWDRESWDKRWGKSKG